MNEENLKPFSERTEKEQREIRQKGGRASVKARRKKAQWKEEARAILELAMKDPGEVIDGHKAGRPKSLDKMKSLKDLQKTNMKAGDGVLAAMLANALHGDRMSAQLLFQLTGALNGESEAQSQAEQVDDGFMDALNGTAAADWEDEAGIEGEDDESGG